MSKHVFTKKLLKKQTNNLKAAAHALQPVVQVGQKGFADSVMGEISSALNAHELIKIQLPGQSDADTKALQLAELEQKLPQHCHIVDKIGRVVILYCEKNPEEASHPLKKYS